MRRLLALLGLVLAFTVFGGGTAMAAPSIAGPPPPTSGHGPSLNPLDGIGSAIMDKLCPQRKAPYPQAPELPVVARGGGPGVYAQRGYAGTFWTTYDAGCMSVDKTDTAIGTEIESLATTVDGLTNELQILALSNSTTASLDQTISVGLKGLHDTFWTPWAGVGAVLAGCLIGLAMWTGRLSDAGSGIVRALVVVTVVVGVVSTPGLIFKGADGMTSGVASGVAASLMKTTPNHGMPASASPEQKFAEGFYQITNRSWLDGAFCGDTDAVKRYGDRLLNDQSFTVAEMRASKDAQVSLVKAKQKDWLAIGREMAKTNPVGFSCWKGATDSRTGAAIKHAVVSIGAGLWVNIGSLGLLALKFLLRIAALFLVTFGALALFSERVADKMAGLVITGLIGPPFMAMAVGTILWAYYALLLDPGAAWWQAGILAFAMGLGLWMAKGIMQSLFSSLSHVGRRGSRHARRAAGRFMDYSQGHRSGLGEMAGAAAVGGAAGAAIATIHERHAGGSEHTTTDSRRDIEMHGEERQESVDTRRTETGGPETQAVPYYMERARATAAAKAARDGQPAPTPVPAPVAPVAREVPAPAGRPEQRAPEMEHGSQREQHAPMTEKRHDNWRRQAIETRTANDDAAHAKAAPVVSQTFAGADSRRADLPE